MINEVNAELLGLYLLLITYGIYLVVFFQCVLVFRRRSLDGHHGTLWLPVATILIFVVAAIHLVTSLIRAWEAFSFKADGISTAVKVFQGVASLPSLLKNASFIAQTILTDAIMVYRTYVVWGLNWEIVIIPLALLCADIAMGTWSMFTLARTGVNGDPIVAEVVVRVKYFYIVTLALNVMCSALISWRIWRVESEAKLVTAKENGNRRPEPGMRIGMVINVIVESAAVYCACLVVLIATAALNSDVMFAILDFMPHLMAIIFSLIIIRAAKEKTYPKTHTSMAGTMQFMRRSRTTGVTTTTDVHPDSSLATRDGGRIDGTTYDDDSSDEMRADLERGLTTSLNKSGDGIVTDGPCIEVISLRDRGTVK
ncbi:uncharacterized protein STEHIDRAFT_171577 [Stereum hirsutum FP-91666 SS1]|uniref:uncharacterized protein n=1 Tax=Stereum hirsutum (strain FP-91666) TaxID=721885 RepID=UPI000444986B|nr:uncharacterized protein STEHIDRAFT_171577 [Stereum hirsutum FP-91666 SS1]EIM81954.1 hypothetical protein STEHIDRAFT_171577 [Stereum hirsutum FP-91666 SS1]